MFRGRFLKQLWMEYKMIKAGLLTAAATLLITCTPAPISNWEFVGEDSYTNVEATFAPHDHPGLEAQIRSSLDLLETGMNSEDFKEFVVKYDYIDGTGEEVYDRFTSSDLNLHFEIKPNNPNMNRPFSVNKTTHIISAYTGHSNPLHRMTAILAHEYGHTIGFDHLIMARSFSMYLQYSGEVFFEEFEKDLRGEVYPMDNMWLTFN